jgi:hypothetical protein
MFKQPASRTYILPVCVEGVGKHAFCWLKPSLGPKRTCLHGVHLTPKSSPKVAMFDLDGTLTESQFG